MKWCRHMTFVEDNMGRSYWSFDASAGLDDRFNKWNATLYKFDFCPVCGTPRPEEKRRKLADVIRDGTVWTFRNPDKSYPMWETSAKAAIEEVIKVYEDFVKDAGSMRYARSFPEYLREVLL